MRDREPRAPGSVQAEDRSGDEREARRGPRSEAERDRSPPRSGGIDGEHRGRERSHRERGDGEPLGPEAQHDASGGQSVADRWAAPRLRAKREQDRAGVAERSERLVPLGDVREDRKSTRLNSSHVKISYA